MSAWATAAHAARRTGRAAALRDHHRGVRAGVGAVARGVQHVPRRRAAAAHPGPDARGASCGSTRRPSTARSSRCGRRPARPPALFAALGEERVRRVVVDRDVRRGRHRPRPRAGLGNLAGGGMSTTPRDAAHCRSWAGPCGTRCRSSLAYAPFGLALGATLGRHAPAAADRLVVLAAAVRRRGPAAGGAAARRGRERACVVVLGALVVNARMLLYSAALAPHTAGVARPLAVAGRLPAGRPGLRAGQRPASAARRGRPARDRLPLLPRGRCSCCGPHGWR